MLTNTYVSRIKTDFLIIGAGIIGLMCGKILRDKFPYKKIVIIDKEPDVGFHASGRNSGILHAGFYYTKDSLKARFCKKGNLFWRNFCVENNLDIKNIGKVVVAKNEKELELLYELKKRGEVNNIELYLINEKELKKIEPYAYTYKYALWSPTTSVVDPLQICKFVKKDLSQKKVFFYFNTCYKKRLTDHVILTNNKVFEAEKIINCAGLYADKIAQDFGCSLDYLILPFKGNYLIGRTHKKLIRTNIYPVPNIEMPFLGVHWILTVDGLIKIGPTALPVIGRENYENLHNLNLEDLFNIIKWNFRLFCKNSQGFRKLAFEELKKVYKNYMLSKAKQLVKDIDMSIFKKWGKSGIRAQLLNKKNLTLELDFIVETKEDSIHVLNAVSPAFTASYPFCKWIIERYI